MPAAQPIFDAPSQPGPTIQVTSDRPSGLSTLVADYELAKQQLERTIVALELHIKSLRK